MQKLNISRCFSITNQGIQHIASNLPQLTYLNVAHCSSVSDEGVSIISSSNLPRLCRLNVSYCGLSDVGVENLRTMSLARAEQMEELNLSFCWTLSISIGTLSQVLSNLKRLNIAGCYMINENGFKSICCNMNKLEHLSIAFCDGFDNECAVMLTRMIQLKHLDMKMCSTVLTEDSFLLIASRLLQLEHLNLYRNKNVTDAVLLCVASCLKHIKVLIMDNNCQLTSVGIVRCVETGLFHRLDHFSVAGCVNVQLQHRDLDMLRCTNEMEDVLLCESDMAHSSA